MVSGMSFICEAADAVSYHDLISLHRHVPQLNRSWRSDA